MVGSEDRRATIDHIVPRSGGGEDIFENTAAACVYCNTRKGSRSVDEYKSQIMGVFAQFERAMIRERVLAGLSRTKEQGIRLGRRRLEDNDAVRSLPSRGHWRPNEGCGGSLGT